LLKYLLILSKISDLRFNVTLWTAVLAWFVAQMIKVMIDFAKTKKIDASLLYSTGGMPSSHTAFVCAMTTAVGLYTGFETSLFALCCVFSLVIMYDAAGVRRAAGEQAAIINSSWRP